MNGSDADKRAVVLLSGGLDSTTVLAIAKSAGYELFALSVDYGQRNRTEIECAAATARHWQVREHKRISIDLRTFGGSSLTSDAPVEKSRPESAIGASIPNTYVPARNTLLLAYALAWAEVIRAGHIFIGVNAVDTSGYPDCRPEFIAAFSTLANLATKMTTELRQRIVIHAPLQQMSKAEIIRTGTRLGVDYALTSSCYDPLPGGSPCGCCDACLLRQRGFEQADLTDPLDYPARES
ncbi:MAG TPA: 7-cyano-7-deazaguanine synthase QueC [Oligoflexia bacterium]|nr:7-cyano-7-deazaguanine synthase QueC [Oligoflexia bacterium]